MKTTSSYIRHGSCAVRPYLYGNPDSASFLQKVFGAQEIERNSSGKGYHIEMRIADSIVVLECGDFPPETLRASVYIYVEDVDETYRRALEAGATPVAEPADKPYQERNAGVKDSFGNTWWIGTYTG